MTDNPKDGGPAFPAAGFPLSGTSPIVAEIVKRTEACDVE